MRPEPGTKTPRTGSGRSVSCCGSPPARGTRKSCIVPVGFEPIRSVSPSSEKSSGYAERHSSSRFRSAKLRRHAAEPGNDLLAVRGQRLLSAVGHQVDVELVDPDRVE